MSPVLSLQALSLDGVRDAMQNSMENHLDPKGMEEWNYPQPLCSKKAQRPARKRCPAQQGPPPHTPFSCYWNSGRGHLNILKVMKYEDGSNESGQRGPCPRPLEALTWLSRYHQRWLLSHTLLQSMPGLSQAMPLEVSKEPGLSRAVAGSY